MRKVLSIIILVLSCQLCLAQSEVHDHDHDHIADSVAVVDTVRIVIDGQSIVSTSVTKQMIEGSIVPYNYDKKYTVEAIDRSSGRHSKLRIEYDGRFWGNVPLTAGANYVDFILREKTKQGVVDVDSTHKVLFVKQSQSFGKQAMLFVEQFSAAGAITSDLMAVQMIRAIKAAGFQSIAVEAIGSTGYASYRKNNLSQSPYLSATQNVRHVDLRKDHLIVETDTLTGDTIRSEYFDLFGALCGAGDTLGVKVYAVFDFFTEGNFTTRDTVSLNAHGGWETQVLTPSGIVPLRQSARVRDAFNKGNRLELAFTNPADPEVQKIELMRVREVIENYPIAGVIMGRCRYGGIDSDFSEVSQRRFAEFLEQKGERIENFPQDVMSIDGHGKIERGAMFARWIEFRSLVIADFAQQLRTLVDSYNVENRTLSLAGYVGDWYDKYFGYAVNWASDKFRYNDHLNFESPELYTETYAATSFLKSLNFLIVGVFNETLQRDVALAELLTNGELPLMVALLMPDQMDAISILHAVEASTAGVMIFDMQRIENFEALAPMLTEAMPKPQPEKNSRRKK